MASWECTNCGLGNNIKEKICQACFVECPKSNISADVRIIDEFPQQIHEQQGPILKDDLINAFIHDIQTLLPYKENPYYIIQEDLITICKSYIFWYEQHRIENSITYQNLYPCFALKRNKYDHNNPYVYIDPVILKQASLFQNQQLSYGERDLHQIVLAGFSYVSLNTLILSHHYDDIHRQSCG